MDTEKILSILTTLSEGFWMNLLLFMVTLVVAIPLGLLISFGSMSKLNFRIHTWRIYPIRWIFRTFVWIIRGTPLMLQLFVVLYGPGLLFDMPMRSRETAAFVAFAINYAAYFSEIFRGGIESIPKGQYEAGQVLAMTKMQVFFKVVLFQVIKRITPPMGNEIITLVKDTSLARIISAYELTFTGFSFAKSAGIIWPLFYTGVFYLIFVGILTLIFNYIERRLDYFK